MKTNDIVQCGVITALLCILCPVSIPVSGIPVTFATLLIYIIAVAAKPHIAIICTALYILIGCIGLPVFSGFAGGIAHVLGPSGGFILGYIPLTICVPLFNTNKTTQIIGMCIGTAVLYICGCIGFMFNTGTELGEVLYVCILPFLPVEIIKIFIAVLTAQKIKSIFKKK